MQMLGLQHYNEAVIRKFSAFFRTLKMDWNEVSSNQRTLNDLTVFSLASIKLGVDSTSVVNANVIAA